jgi:ribosomal protein S18 acetylase RimI-like enzyme
MPCDGPVHSRRAVVADAAGIARVYLAGWQEAHVGLVPNEYLTCMRARGQEEFWRGELEIEVGDRKPWVALVDEDIVGFASGGLSSDEDAPGGVAEIYQVYVAPGCWGRGIGEGLLRHVLKDLREHGFSRVDTWVVRANVRARAFFERQGWRPDGATRLEDCGDTQVEQVRYSHALR